MTRPEGPSLQPWRWHADRLARAMRVYVWKRGRRVWWTTPGTPNETRISSRNLLDGYFLDFSDDADYNGPTDAVGVPLIDYGGRIGCRYNPWFVGHTGLACLDRYRKTQIDRYRERFMVMADWLVSSGVETAYGGLLWPYDFSPFVRCATPWHSCLAQAHAISVLLRASLLSQKERYVDAARKAFTTLHTPIEKGGVLNQGRAGDLFAFEEVAIIPSNTILNGFVFAIWAVYDYWHALGDDVARDLIADATRSLLRLLPLFELGYWSSYAIEHGNLGLPAAASSFYHCLHVRQLEVMWRLTGEWAFADVAERWDEYGRRRLNRTRALVLKMLYKLTTG